MRRVLVPLVAIVVGVVFTAAILITLSTVGSNTVGQDQLCANNHALVEMQRLFLAEHEAIRHELREAGIPTEHADPDLLEELEVLINAADCNPEKGP